MDEQLFRTPKSTRRAHALLSLAAVATLASLTALGCGAARDGDDDTTAHRRGSRALPALHSEGAAADDEDAEASDEGVVHWEAKLTEDAPGLLDEFRRRASRYGCQTASDDESVLAKCAEAPIKLVKRGRRVSVACQGVSLAACRDLFGRIVDVEKQKDGQNPRLW